MLGEVKRRAGMKLASCIVVLKVVSAWARRKARIGNSSPETDYPPDSLGHVIRRAARRYIPFAMIFILAMFLLTLNANSPWRGQHEDNGLAFESIAINHIRFGLAYTKGQDYIDSTVTHSVFPNHTFHPVGVPSAQQFQYFRSGPVHPILYGHHPPLLGITIAGSLLIFGYHFWAVRLVPIVFTLGALALFYLLMLLLFDAHVAALASLLFISFPITAYYGRNVAHEAPTMCCELGLAICYVLWRRSNCNAWLVGVAGCVALGAAYGWPMVFFAWILCGLNIVARRRVQACVFLASAGAATLTFGLVVTQIAWAAGWSLRTLDAAFLMRAASFGVQDSTNSALAGAFWLIRILEFNALDYGLWTWLALPVALRFMWGRLRSEGYTVRLQMIALLGLGGIAHILLFRDGAYVHDYWQFYLIPLYAVSLGWSGVTLTRWIASRSRLLSTSLRFKVQLALLVGFATIALMLAAPIIAFLYAGMSGHDPVTPLLRILAQVGRRA